MNKNKLHYAFIEDRCGSLLGGGILGCGFRSRFGLQMVSIYEAQSSSMAVLVEDMKKLRDQNRVFF